MQTQWLGLQNYQDGLKVQQNLWERAVVDPTECFIVGLEHNSTITLGKRGNREIDLLESESFYSNNQIEIIASDRGGEATLHSPGQLVIYPILSLQQFFHSRSVRQFVSLLENTTIELLHRYNIPSFKKEEPGIYTESGKIAFLGLRIEKGVTRHGLSFNVNNDLSLFNSIRSCGVLQQKHTSLYHLLQDDLITTENLFLQWIEIFNYDGRF